MTFDAPFRLGPFAVGPDGRLALAAPETRPRFEIDWRGCRVVAELGTVGADNALGELSLRAVIGRVPSTARAPEARGPRGRSSGGRSSGGRSSEGRSSGGRPSGEQSPELQAPSATAAQRNAVFEALRSLPGTLPAGWRADLLADHRVAMLSAGTVAMPTTVESLVTDVTLFLLALGPYLDLMAELGVEPPAGAA